MVQGVEEATTELPIHECKRRVRIAEMHGRSAGNGCIGRSKQLQPGAWAVADVGDALRSDRRGRDAAP